MFVLGIVAVIVFVIIPVCFNNPMTGALELEGSRGCNWVHIKHVMSDQQCLHREDELHVTNLPSLAMGIFVELREVFILMMTGIGKKDFQSDSISNFYLLLGYKSSKFYLKDSKFNILAKSTAANDQITYQKGQPTLQYSA